MHSNCPANQELSRLLTGDLSEAKRRALEDHVESCPDCRRRLEAIAALQKEPVRSYRSPQALVHDLKRFAREAPVLGPLTDACERIWMWFRRKPGLAGALLGLTFVLVIGIAAATLKWRGAARERRIADRESRRAQTVSTHLEIEKSLRAGDPAWGLATLARLLRQQPTNAIVVERLMNALSYRAFCLPVAALPPSRIACVNFSRDGHWFVTAGLDGQARLWDGLTGQPAGPPLLHEDAVLWAQFSPDGTRLVTTSKDRCARIWEVPTGRLLLPPFKHDASIGYAAFSPDGSRLVTATETGKTRIWNVASGENVGPLLEQPCPLVFADFSPDARHLLTAERHQPGGKPHSPAALWDAETGTMVQPLPHHFQAEGRNPFPCFSPSGDRILIRDNLNALVIPTAAAPSIQLAHDKAVVALAYAPDGRRVATGCHDGSARIWNLTQSNAHVATTLLAHKQSVLALDFSRDGTKLLTASADRTARLWNADNGRALCEALRHETAVRNVALETNNHRLITVTETGAGWLWDVRCDETRATSFAGLRGVKHARFTADGRFVAALSRLGIFVLDGRTGWPVREPILARPVQPGTQPATETQSAQILQFDLSADGRYLAAALEDGSVRVWEIFGTNSAPVFSTQEGSPDGRPLTCLKFSPDGRRLVTGSEDGRTMVWQLDSGRLLFELERHKDRVNQVEFSHDGKQLVTASADQSARLWDAATGKPLLPHFAHEKEVHCAMFDPAGELVATASRDKTVRLWSTRTGDLRHAFVHPDALAEKYPLHFSPDGSRLTTAAGNSLQVWDVRTGETVMGPIRQNGQIMSVRFSPNGRRLVTAASDGIACMFDAATGFELSEPLGHDAQVAYAEFSPDGTRIVTSSWDDQVRIWPVIRAPLPAPPWLADLAEAVAGVRLDEHNGSQAVPIRQLLELRQKLQTSSAPGYYSGWARWFFADSQERSSL
jgi:WD40 repeat protein